MPKAIPAAYTKRLAIFTVAALFLLLVLPARAQTPSGKATDTAWPIYQHDQQHTGRGPLLGPTHQPELLWTALPYCSGENGGMAITQDGSLLLPVGGCLHSFDPVTRQAQWTYEFGGSSRSTPGLFISSE